MALLEGKVVLVTGAGRGVGRAHAITLARQGARVVVNDIGAEMAGHGQNRALADGVVEEIRSFGAEATADYSDMSRWDGAERAIQTAIHAFGKLDGLLNNAGNQRRQELADLVEEDFDSLMAVHLKGSFACTVHACRYWRERFLRGDPPRAAVLNTFSEAVLVALPNYVAYGAAKSAILHLTTAGSREAARYGVRINAYGPRALTRMMPGYYEGMEEKEKGHPKDPFNSSALVAWLLSDQSSHVTGQAFHTVGGGIARCTPWAPQHIVWPKGRVRFEPEEIGDIVNAEIFGSRVREMILEEPPPAP
jgi:NAD(P)-dependent dehydrogenase (short-subunit alcohol dehydrogenase family)